MISDRQLNDVAVSLGVITMILIVVFQTINRNTRQTKSECKNTENSVILSR